MPINWGQIINAAAQVAGQAAASRAAGRTQQAMVTQGQDRGALEAYTAEQAARERALEAQQQGGLTRAGGQLNEANLALGAPGQRASNAVRGDILANAQDVSVSHPRANIVNFSGGLRPSLLSDNTRQLGQSMSREALLSQMQGTPTPYSDVQPTDFSSVLGKKAPTQTPLPNSNALDRILEAIGLYGSLAGGIGTALKPPPAATPPQAAKPSEAAGAPRVGYDRYSQDEYNFLHPPQRQA